MNAPDDTTHHSQYPLMSALGEKRTFHEVQTVSVLPAKADVVQQIGFLCRIPSVVIADEQRHNML